MILDELLEENTDVLKRLKEYGDEYYTVEQLVKSFEKTKEKT